MMKVKIRFYFCNDSNFMVYRNVLTKTVFRIYQKMNDQGIGNSYNI